MPRFERYTPGPLWKLPSDGDDSKNSFRDRAFVAGPTSDYALESSPNVYEPEMPILSGGIRHVLHGGLTGVARG